MKSIRAAYTFFIRILPFVPFVALTLFFLWTGPDALVAWIGVENSYLLLAILAFIGGVTTFSGVPYHVVLFTFAAGGLNPLLLGVITAAAVSLGDTTSYLIGYYGRRIMPKRLSKVFEHFQYYIEHHPKLVPVGIFFYGALIPLSSDLITIPMGFLKYPMWKVLLPLGVGTALFNIGIAYAAVYSQSIVSFFM